MERRQFNSPRQEPWRGRKKSMRSQGIGGFVELTDDSDPGRSIVCVVYVDRGKNSRPRLDNLRFQKPLETVRKV